VNGNARNLGWFQWCRLHAPRLVVGSVAPDWHLFHLVQYFPSIQELTKDGVQVVQMWLLLVQNEELRLYYKNGRKSKINGVGANRKTRSDREGQSAAAKVLFVSFVIAHQ
jgi:hypothetical protein